MASAAPTQDDSATNSFPVEPANEPTPASLDLSQLEDDVRDVFSFNDIEPEPTPAAPAAAPEPGEGVGQAPSPSPVAPSDDEPPQTPVAPQPATPAAPATPPAAPAAPAPATPPADDAALRQASLEAQVAALTSTIEQLRANPPAAQAQQPQQPAAGPGSAQEEPLRYNMSLPEAVTQALQSDDPTHTAQAVTWVANAVATLVHNNLRAEYRKHFEDRVNSLVTEASQAEAEQRQTTTVEQARDQYYQKFTEHKNPLIQPIVAAEAQKLATQYPGISWGEEFMNSLGARVNAAIASLRGETQAAPQPAPTPAPRPAGHLPAAGPRPMVPVGGATAEDLIYETMSEGQFW